MQNVRIEDIMSEQPIKVKENVPVGSVAHLLLRYRINGLLVVKEKDEHHLVGILTTTDLLRLIDVPLSKRIHRMKALKKIAHLTAGQVASRNVQSLKKGDKVVKAVALMHRKNIHTIPIYHKKKLVGVLGKHDILNMALI